MERYKKKDMLQTVDMLLKANDAIVRTTRSNPKGAAEALVQCQESAIALGTYIDTLDEKYANLVHILEDYCENIYQMSENLSDESVCRKASKKIQKQMTSLKNGIKYDLPDDKKEIVFLPYKASMWDSLESVWKAADADPDCDAYVIPIPYFDKNPNGSFREEHYEGDLYPKNVPITRYDEYDLEARHPDVIYIHNPYDECNHVTSVHPYFYSKNLRNFTDKLVYIPYFILGEIEPDNQAAVDGMKHFCFTPGTIYAHQVVVQSENMRQIYINEYLKAAKEMGLPGEHVDRKFLEKKFLGTGSPKVDKVLNTKKEDLEIPAEWLKVIEKPDGSWKKIIFYNTSVSALLKHSEKMLRKMESVFGIFKENQDEVALLWRPHPLIQATIESMRPELWIEYDKLVRKYREEEWGIYDDTSDLDRAIVLSDAYYGSQSSVVELCRKMKQPIILQNIIAAGCLTDRNIPTVWTNTEFTIDGDTIWFVPYEYCYLYQYDYVRKRVCKKIFLEGAKSLWGSHYSVAKVGKYVVLVPGVNNSIYILDNDSYVIQQIRLPEKENIVAYFRKYAIWNKAIFLFPIDYPNVVKVSLIDFSVEEISIPRVDNIYPTSTIITDVLQRGKFVDLCMNGSNKILRFDMDSYEGKYFSIINVQECKMLCAYGENQILLIGKDKSAFIYDENFEKFRVINLPPNNSGYIACERYKDGYILIPYKKSDPIFYWSQNTYDVVVQINEEQSRETQKSWSYNDYSQVKIAGNKALLFDMPDQSLCVIDIGTFEKEYQKVEMGEIDEAEKQQLYLLFRKADAVIEETRFWTLRRLIDVLKVDKNEECRENKL